MINLTDVRKSGAGFSRSLISWRPTVLPSSANENKSSFPLIRCQTKKSPQPELRAYDIGSAAGVAAMGIEKIKFGWYLWHVSWLALIEYFAGAVVYLAQHHWLL